MPEEPLRGLKAARFVRSKEKNQKKSRPQLCPDCIGIPSLHSCLRRVQKLASLRQFGPFSRPDTIGTPLGCVARECRNQKYTLLGLFNVGLFGPLYLL